MYVTDKVYYAIYSNHVVLVHLINNFLVLSVEVVANYL